MSVRALLPKVSQCMDGAPTLRSSTFCLYLLASGAMSFCEQCGKVSESQLDVIGNTCGRRACISCAMEIAHQTVLAKERVTVTLQIEAIEDLLASLQARLKAIDEAITSASSE